MQKIPPHRVAESGFTLIELMIVTLIVGILVTVGLANTVSTQGKAKYASCISNQHYVHRAAITYAGDNPVGTVVINVTVLTASDLLTQEVGECPSSDNAGFDDYTVEYVDNRVTNVTCSIEGIEHEYPPR